MNPPGVPSVQSDPRRARARARPRADASPTCGSSTRRRWARSSRRRRREETAARSPAARRRRLAPWKVYPLKVYPRRDPRRLRFARVSWPNRRRGTRATSRPRRIRPRRCPPPPSRPAIPRRTRRPSPRLLVSGRSPGSPRRRRRRRKRGDPGRVPECPPPWVPRPGPRGAPRPSRSGRGRTQGAAPSGRNGAARPTLHPPPRLPSPPRRPQRCDTRPRRGVRSPDVRAMGRRGSPGPSAAASRAARRATRRPPAIRPGRLRRRPRRARSRRMRATPPASAGDLGSDPAPRPPPTIAPIFPKPPAPPLARETAAPASETQPEPRLPTVVPMLRERPGQPIAIGRG